MTDGKLVSLPAELSRGQGLAAWRQIVDGIEADIAAGRLAVGEQLPSEAVLASHFRVNRHTVRRALAALAERGLVRSAQGRGSFVEDKPVPYPIGQRTRFSEIMSRAGREASGELLGARETSADAATAKALGIRRDAPVLELRTRHKADGTPISVATTRLPLPRFCGLERAYAKSGSLTRAYKAFGVADYRRLSTKVTARVAPPEEAHLLELTPGRAVLVIESVNVDVEGTPIQATRSTFAADRVELLIGT